MRWAPAPKRAIPRGSSRPATVSSCRRARSGLRASTCSVRSTSPSAIGPTSFRRSRSATNVIMRRARAIVAHPIIAAALTAVGRVPTARFQPIRRLPSYTSSVTLLTTPPTCGRSRRYSSVRPPRPTARFITTSIGTTRIQHQCRPMSSRARSARLSYGRWAICTQGLLISH